MAERLPIGTTRISDIRPLGSSSPTHEVCTAATEKASSPLTSLEPHSIASNTLVVSNAPRVLSNHASNTTEVANSEATARHKNRGTKADTTHGDEWVEQDEPGVYITLVSSPTGVKDLKRVRFRHVSFAYYFIHPNLKKDSWNCI